jgi:solute carrier family 35 (UDP-sugar transporter), member A1/2/3
VCVCAVCGRPVAIKYLSLLVLVLQNSSLVLLMRWSRVAQGEPYIASTAVVAAEVVKLVASLFLIYRQMGSWPAFVSHLHETIIARKDETISMAVPAILYTVQNNLLFVAVSNLEAATYQVTYQLKILTTAIFSIIMLGRHLSGQKWLALLALMVGVALVQLDNASASSGGGGGSGGSGAAPGNAWVGLGAVILACLSSGYAGVYFEKKLKESHASIWVRNVQLGGYGTVIGLIGSLYNDHDAIMAKGFFQGYNSLVWMVVANSALGGLLVAVVVKYADNILKGFATSVSIVVSSIVSVLFLGFLPSLRWTIGAAFVLSATVLYSQPDPQPPKLPL